MKRITMKALRSNAQYIEGLKLTGNAKLKNSKAYRFWV